ncbi:hypothetical protein EDD15DRAFT_2521761 [Pisolithus albus]|nr:hypothetical protein EDD15DRAFT_2521761 [Pisolithus albus]
MAENKGGEEYLVGIAELVTKNASEAAHVPVEVERKSEQAIHDKARTLRRETEANREVKRAKRGLTVKVTQAAGDKTAQEAEESARAAREALEEAEERLKKGIRPIVVLRAVASQCHPPHRGVTEIGDIDTTVEKGQGLCNSWLDCTSAPEVSSCLMAPFVRFDDRFTQTNIPILTNRMRFQIPTYNVRLKADIHSATRMSTAVIVTPQLDHGRFIADTRANVKKKFTEGGLPDQRIHAVSNKARLSRTAHQDSPTIDELKLTKDVLDEACTRLTAQCAQDTTEVSARGWSSRSDCSNTASHAKSLGGASESPGNHGLQGEQTADGVPNEAFEALIDLLIPDGIDDAPPGTSIVPQARVAADGAALRDESGRLDFKGRTTRRVKEGLRLQLTWTIGDVINEENENRGDYAYELSFCIGTYRTFITSKR